MSGEAHDMRYGGWLFEPAHAKINLHLHVTGRRADGYHLLDSLAVFAGAHDVLSGRSTDRPGVEFAVEGPFGASLAGEDPAGNLVVRAARLLLGDDDPRGIAFVLDKRLPVASGIGGGSADAAAALRLVGRLRPDLAVPPDRLAALAAALGADVPVCLGQRPARMGGVGERLSPAPALPDCGIVLVNCGVGVPTPAVFRARAPGFSPMASLPGRWPDAAAMAADLSLATNDLQAAAVVLCPPIETVLAAIAAEPGCLLARMSGSGATCFGLFAGSAGAERAATSLRRPGWWTWGGALHDDGQRPTGSCRVAMKVTGEAG